MKRINFGFLIAAALLTFAPAPAFAAASVAKSLVEMCAGSSVATARGPRQVTNPSTTTTYTLGANGCALMSRADQAYFASQGYYQGAGAGTIYTGPFTAQSTAANSPVLPANAYIEAIIVQETTGNALTGGLDVGVAGSSDATIVSGYAIGANAVINIPAASILKNVFPTSGTGGPAAQQIYFNAHTSWNSGSIVVTILYRYY